MDAVESTLRRLIAEHSTSRMSPDEILLTRSLNEQGVDSYSYMEIILDIESEMGIQLDDETLITTRLDSLQDFLDYLQTKAPS